MRGIRSTAPRHGVLLGVLLLVAGLLTTGCAGGDPPPTPRVTGSFGNDPVITMPNGDPGNGLVVKTLIHGHGSVVGPNDYVMINVEGKVWAGDREVVDSYTSHQPQGLPLADGLPAYRRLAGQHVGSRVLLVVPPRYGFGSKGDASANIMGSDTLVFVVDILTTLPVDARATGAPVAYHPGADMPMVSGRGATQRITIPKGAKPPTHLVTAMLNRGTGPAILNGHTAVVQYTGVVWRTGTVFDSSWQHKVPEAFVLGAGQVLPGWEQGLGGVRVGSRVLLVVPPALGYGQQGDAPDVRSGDTLVFVFDVLAMV